jgi:GTPase SAR1 family protein
MAKTLIIGDSGVGKTSIIKQLTHHEQVHQHAATIGLEFGMKNY